MKKMISALFALMVMCSSASVLTNDLQKTATVVAAAEDTMFDAQNFFVVVGTYGGQYIQMRYMGENSAEKVVWTSAPQEFDYGDVLVAENEVSMKRVQSAPNDPSYAMAYHYELNESVKLTKVGNCTDFMEKKNLTVTDKTYDGSSHWSMRFSDTDGTEFYYGLNTLSSSLGVNVLNFDVGDVCTFAFYNGEVIVPLEKTAAAEDTAFDAQNFFVVVGTYGGQYTQLRYMGEDFAEKVIWTSAPQEFDYGDVLVAENEVSMKRVQSAPNDPSYAMAYHYELNESVKLTKVGNCTDFMEKKNLTVTDKTYDGSSHWSMRFSDTDGTEFYYGLNTLSSSLGVNVLNFDVGDVCTFAFYNGEVIVPLAKITESIDVLGDINGDGIITPIDASYALSAYAALATDEAYGITDKNFSIYDVDKSGDITPKDASLILSYYAYLSTGGKDPMEEWLDSST